MSKVLVRKQLFDPKQTANNMGAVNDLSSGGAIEQIGILNLLGGQKSIAQDAAEKLGYGTDSPQYRRMRLGENIGRGLAGLYGGYRMMDAVASGRSPTSAIGAGAGAYGSLAPIAGRVGVRAASGGIGPKPEPEPEPEKTRQTTLDEFSDVKPPVSVKPSTPAASPAAAASSVAVVKPPSPLETQAHGLKPGQTVFGTEYAGPAQPARVKVVEPTVAMNPPDKNMLSYGAQIKPAEGSQTATTQSQQGQPPTNQQKQTLSRDPFETKLIDYVNNAEREKQLEQARRDQSEQSSNVLPSSDIDGI